MALPSRGHQPGASRGTLLTLVFRHVQDTRPVKFANKKPNTFLKRWKLDRAIYDAFIFMDNAYFGFSLPKGTGSERALVF